MESKHITMKAPSYNHGCDDDQSSWTIKTSFVGVDYALGYSRLKEWTELLLVMLMFVIGALLVDATESVR